MKKLIVCMSEYLYIFLTILECNTVYSGSDRFAFLPYVIVVVAVILFVSKMTYYHLKKGRLNKYLGVLIVYLCIVVLYAVTNVSSTLLAGYAAKFLFFVPISIGIFYLPDATEANQIFIKRFVNVVCFLAFFSLLFWIFGVVLHVISPNMTYRSYWAKDINFKGYFGLLFENQYNETLRIYRNCGIFTEGPMYSVWLVFALCFELFNINIDTRKSNKNHNFKVVILTLAILSTMTTAGILAMVALYAYRILFSTSNSKIKKLLRFLIVLIFLIALGSPLLSLVRNKMESYSGITRLASLTSSLTAWFNHPIFGNGYNSMKNITAISNTLYGRDTGNSNSIFLILAQGGIVFASIYIVPLIATLVRGIKEKNRVLLIDFYIILFEMVVTWIPYKFALLMLISLFYVNLIEKSKIIMNFRH